MSAPSIPDEAVLDVMRRRGRATSRQVADELGAHVNSVAAALSRLEDRSLVRIAPSGSSLPRGNGTGRVWEYVAP